MWSGSKERAEGGEIIERLLSRRQHRKELSISKIRGMGEPQILPLRFSAARAPSSRETYCGASRLRSECTLGSQGSASDAFRQVNPALRCPSGSFGQLSGLLSYKPKQQRLQEMVELPSISWDHTSKPMLREDEERFAGNR
ncbi:hypothetical protein TNIN_388811 [Trichonephila inaurata madagascariensis]|uniref:Uncharacterized protein n=1 Tax=Trichonephila inaurata madagascariensis TaxID=2747483 RepID=A0A8X6M8P3_9ARAC|nr:hypothetical protein TNIN_388811 [Trichonephila inaurata madagascariensis]